jgi:hypothetical protein
MATPTFFRISSAMSTATSAIFSADEIEGLGALAMEPATLPATRHKSFLRGSIRSLGIRTTGEAAAPLERFGDVLDLVFFAIVLSLPCSALFSRSRFYLDAAFSTRGAIEIFRNTREDRSDVCDIRAIDRRTRDAFTRAKQSPPVAIPESDSARVVERVGNDRAAAVVLELQARSPT